MRNKWELWGGKLGHTETYSYSESKSLELENMKLNIENTCLALGSDNHCIT